MEAKDLYNKMMERISSNPTPMESLAQGLAEEILSFGLDDSAQTIANYISDNSDWESSLDFAVSEKGSYLSEAVMDDFISDVQFFMGELSEVEND